MTRLLAAFAILLALSGCARVTALVQTVAPPRPATGLVTGAVGGDFGLAATGPAGGLAGGLITETVKKNATAAFQQGYAAGQPPPLRR
jgi:hypothetical protein